MRARERGSEGVGLGYGDIGFIDVYNKVVQETCKINRFTIKLIVNN